jgi:hypothetical protein
MTKIASVSAFVILATLVVGGSAAGQPTTGPLADVGRVKPGAKVTVTDHTGERVIGQLQAISPSSLTLLVADTDRSLTFAGSDVNWNGGPHLTRGGSEGAGHLDIEASDPSSSS